MSLYTPNCKKCTTSPKGLNGLIPLGEGRPLYTPSCQISPGSDTSPKELNALIPLGEGRSLQSPKNFVGASALPTGKFLRAQKVFALFTKLPIEYSQNIN